MGYIRIIASILNDAHPRALFTRLGKGKREGGSCPSWKHDLDRIGKIAGAPAQIGRLGRRRGAGARGPAAAQRSGGFTLVHTPSYIVPMISDSRIVIGGYARRPA
jgi:hypothetical protein